MATRYHVKRTRTHDSSVDHAQLGYPSKVGQVGYSRAYANAEQAEREAAAWRATGDWTAEVIPGRPPRRT